MTIVTSYAVSANKKEGLRITIFMKDDEGEVLTSNVIIKYPPIQCENKSEYRNILRKRDKFSQIVNNNYGIEFECQRMMLGYLIGVIHGIGATQRQIFGEGIYDLLEKNGIRG